MADAPCPTCGGVLIREMGVLHRCAGCRRSFSVLGGHPEPLRNASDLSGLDDLRAEQALRRRGA